MTGGREKIFTQQAQRCALLIDQLENIECVLYVVHLILLFKYYICFCCLNIPDGEDLIALSIFIVSSLDFKT
jgi:hypothetical protein